MDLNYSPEESAFRDEVRAWIRENLSDELRDKVLNYRELSKDELLGWHKLLARKGWVAQAVQHAAEIGNSTGHAGRSLVVDSDNRFDGVLGI